MSVKSYPLIDRQSLAFVSKYLEIGEPDGRKAAKEVFGTASRAVTYLTNPNIVAAIREAEGPEPQLRSLAITPEEHRFIDTYLETLDNAKTAEKLGMPKNVVDAILRRPGVVNEIELRLREVRLNSIIRAEEVLEELAIIGFSNITDYCSFDHDTVIVKRSSEMMNTQAISEVVNTKEGVKIKLHNKLQALDSLAKFMGLYKEKVEVTGKDGGAIKIESPIESINQKLDQMFANKQALDLIRKEKENDPGNNDGE